MGQPQEQSEEMTPEDSKKEVEVQTESSSLQSEERTEVEFETPDFSELTDFVDGDDREETPAVTTESDTPVETPEETPEEVTAETVESVVEEPEKKVEEEKKEEVKTPPKQEVEEEPPVAEVKMPTKEELEGMYKEHREKTLPTLENLFQLSEEEAAALDEQPSKVIPKLASQMMYDTMLSTYNAVIAAMPSVVNRLVEASRAASEAENEFYSAWPDLKTREAVPVIKASIQAYKSSNPRAKRQDIIKNVGVMSMITLGLDPSKVSEPKAETSAPAVKTVPPKPAAPRGTSQTTAPKPKGSEEKNEFAELTELFLKDN